VRKSAGLSEYFAGLTGHIHQNTQSGNRRTGQALASPEMRRNARLPLQPAGSAGWHWADASRSLRDAQALKRRGSPAHRTLLINEWVLVHRSTVQLNLPDRADL